MPRINSILEQTLDTQRDIGRLIQADTKMSLKTIAQDSGIPYSTVCTYFSQEANLRLAELPLSNYVRLVGVLPDDWLSRLLDPADRHLAQNGDADNEFDDLADKADEVAREVRRARHPRSPGGTEIIATEEERIRHLTRALRIATPERVAEMVA